MPKNDEAALIVLAKPPLLGRCKTRLAKDLGSAPAARLARAMLVDAWGTASAFAAARRVALRLARAGAPEEYPLLAPAPRAIPQPEGDLGRRMAGLLADALATSERVLLLGTDAPGLPPPHLDAALAALDSADVVLGRVRDGGFWCLGGRAGASPLRDPSWLDGLDWEAAGTAAAVRTRAAALGLRVAEAPPWLDLDTADDLRLLSALLRLFPWRAPALARTLREEDELRRAGTPLLSVIVAALDEGSRLDACLAALRNQPGPLEIVVADGGSQDGSAERAAAASDLTLVRTPAGRGGQLAAGAALSTGSLLLFLHADARLPPHGTDLVRAALAGGAHEAGAFVTRTEPDPELPNRAGPLLALADLRSRWTRHPYGDQALFVTRTAYEACGGFRPLPILEDWDLSVRLAARGRLARLRTPVLVSGRRMQQRPLRSLLLMRLIPPLYRLGVSPERLARLYRRG